MKRTIFTEDHEAFRDAYRRFLIAEVEPHTEAWREEGIVPREMYRRVGELGYLLIWADEQYGGLGLEDFRFQQVIMEEDAKYSDPGFFHTLHSRLVGPYLKHFANDEQKTRFLPKCVSGETILAVAMTEPGAGSDLAGMKTRAEDKGDHWVLNGSKTYISNGINSDLIITAAKTNPENPRQIGLFIIEGGMEGLERGRKLKKMGMKAQDTAELFFNDLKIPKKNVLGDPTKGFHYLMQGLAEERLICAVDCLAVAQHAFDLTLAFVKNRNAFGRRIADFQNTRFKLAAMRTELDAAQHFVDDSVKNHCEGKLTGELAAEVKLFTSEVEARVLDECVQLHGGAGYMDEYQISRMYTNSRIHRIYAGTSEIMKEIISRKLILD